MDERINKIASHLRSKQEQEKDEQSPLALGSKETSSMSSGGGRAELFDADGGRNPETHWNGYGYAVCPFFNNEKESTFLAN